VTIPYTYVVRNLATRKLTTLLTAGGMALVVYVFATVLMLAAGLRETLVSTGQDDNVMVIRRSAQTEVQSAVDRVQAAVVESLPDIAVGGDGRRLVSKEPVAVITLPKRATGKPSNVVIRGVTAEGRALRPRVRIVAGRLPQPGTSEIAAGRAIAAGFQGGGIGETMRFASRDWTVVGIFDAGRSGFDSEVWGDAEQMLQALRRQAYSSVIFKLADPQRFAAVKEELEHDPRLTLEAKRETEFYAEQSEALAKFISYLGTSISVIFSIGAIIGAMITMYASVASRTAEIGTLRALGFSRHSIRMAFLIEALLLGLTGGVGGLIAASLMQALTFSTMNFQTFAEVAFRFTLTGPIVAASLLFSLLMGSIHLVGKTMAPGRVAANIRRRPRRGPAMGVQPVDGVPNQVRIGDNRRRARGADRCTQSQTREESKWQNVRSGFSECSRSPWAASTRHGFARCGSIRWG
jgi:ABC-type lipoprotein release transport system permease subunit